MRITKKLVEENKSNLYNANLRDANLIGTDLTNCIGNMREIRSMQLEKYHIVFTKDIIAIGCEQHTYEEWENFTDDEISNMDEGALEFWNKWKEHIFKTIELAFGEN